MSEEVGAWLDRRDQRKKLWTKCGVIVDASVRAEEEDLKLTRAGGSLREKM